MDKTELRYSALQRWLETVLPTPVVLQPMAPGAGVRRYFRVGAADQRFVVMDSPADEKFKTFVRLTEAFQRLGVHVPSIHAVDWPQGFLLLTDFGDHLYEHLLNAENADRLYQQAWTALLRIQSYSKTSDPALKPFDMVYYREKMNWFIEFYWRRRLKCSLTLKQEQECERLFDLLIATAEQQPKTCVHYDYHCRNLMVLPHDQVGVLDFQDAVLGPVTYDLMSLLRDCYIDWPAARVQGWLQQYQQAALVAGIVSQEDPVLWQRWCDFSSVQRHIKCIGLFARFQVLGYSMDYLPYIPRLLRYLREITARYPEMAGFQVLLEKIPR